ncbi:MAG TPA: UbiA prenyltransferase family protein [Gaiellaceae bacterium]|nr:UbiA prenyltransferase family protein [Gaiellaceae bacterium]
MSSAAGVPQSRHLHLPALAVALRPHQWTKNLLLLAGLLFSGSLGDGARWGDALVALTAYCLLSSAGYLVNDVRDAASDRLHPTKRLRPVASGELRPATALVTAAALAGMGLGLAAAIGHATLALAAAFALGQLAYTLWLKRLMVLDAAMIAGLFVVRSAAGAEAIGVRISTWLLVCTALLALFLAFAKRRGELLAIGGDLSAGRAVLRHYTARRLELLVGATAAGSCAAYIAYAVDGSDAAEMALTIPFVVFGLARYLYLMRRRDLGEEPDRVLLTDPPILVAVVLWALVAATALNAG